MYGSIASVFGIYEHIGEAGIVEHYWTLCLASSHVTLGIYTYIASTVFNETSIKYVNEVSIHELS